MPNVPTLRYILSFGRCHVGVWRVCEWCQEDVWIVSGRRLEGFWKVSKGCLEVA